MNRRILAVSMAAIAVTAALPIQVRAEAKYDLRKKVVGLSGIMNVFNTQAAVTRGEFANMLVMASPYGSGAGQSGITSVYSDVPREHKYASYIKIAAEAEWMSGYLGGTFRPEQSVTMREAVSAALALLGYTDKDFTGDLAGGQRSKSRHLKLNEEIERDQNKILDRKDVINLFYNLLRAVPKDGTGIYGKLFKCELTSDGEINPLNMLNLGPKGPKLIRSTKSLSSYIPFKLEQASVFINGQPSSVSSLKSEIGSNDYVLVYYHPATKAIRAYIEGGEETGRGVIRGEITNIYYSSADVMIPSAVTIDGQDTQYQLKGSEVQFAFSMYGDVKVRDWVALVYEKTTQSDGTEIYTVVDYLEG